jgi:hypothetical protein
MQVMHKFVLVTVNLPGHATLLAFASSLNFAQLRAFRAATIVHYLGRSVILLFPRNLDGLLSKVCRALRRHATRSPENSCWCEANCCFLWSTFAAPQDEMIALENHYTWFLGDRFTWCDFLLLPPFEHFFATTSSRSETEWFSTIVVVGSFQFWTLHNGFAHLQYFF